MRSKIKKCRICDLYTLKENCPICGAATSQTKPARFSPEDRYGRYRRALRQEAE
ncbi:MAG TPA: RNA-protein complex protein Nop10 [Methanothrix sp.]|nr:RNA-protein complex protein Nop10 [Methanothrix sp.]HPJ84750.1 RNA-protein complex protein Nop10 [Methanothrix sp.]HPR66240.1 RNA-protein complex protein Nop10 [Methanothrix sp.]